MLRGHWAWSSTPIDTEFPTRFRLRLYVAPDRAVLDTLALSIDGGAQRVVLGRIVAMPSGQTLEDSGTCNLCGEPLGVVTQYVIGYAYPGEGSFTGPTFGDWFLDTGIAAGYHLFELVPASDPACPMESADCLRLTREDIDTEVLLEMGALLDLPSWD